MLALLLDVGTELFDEEEVEDMVDEADDEEGEGDGNCAVEEETTIEMAARSLALP